MSEKKKISKDEMHCVTNVDIEDLMGDCSICGRIDIRLPYESDPPGFYRCMNKIRLKLKDKEIHRLSNKDLINKTAICSICGPTNIKGQDQCQVPFFRSAKNRAEKAEKSGKKTQRLTYIYPAENGDAKITRDERAQLLNDFGIYCNICGKEMKTSKNTHLDHCHITGYFRGALCQDCNFGLGRFKDNLENMKKAVAYLERAQEAIEALDRPRKVG